MGPANCQGKADADFLMMMKANRPGRNYRGTRRRSTDVQWNAIPSIWKPLSTCRISPVTALV
jgi:hypothetical protein